MLIAVLAAGAGSAAHAADVITGEYWGCTSPEAVEWYTEAWEDGDALTLMSLDEECKLVQGMRFTMIDEQRWISNIRVYPVGEANVELYVLSEAVH